MSIQQAIEIARNDLDIDHLDRRLAAIRSCQPGPGRPDARYPASDDVSAAGERRGDDNPSAPEHDMRALTHAAVALAANAAVIRRILDRYPGTEVVAAARRGSKITIDDTWDGCIDCAQDTRNGRPYWTLVDPRHPNARLCDWCSRTRLRWDVSRVPVGLVCLHHDGKRISEQMAQAAVAKMPKAQRQLGEYTQRLAREADALTEEVAG